MFLQWLKFVFRCISNFVFGNSKKKSVEFNPVVMIECDEHGVTKLIINRPAKKNAITESMYKLIQKSLKEVSDDKRTKVCLIIGKGDFYSAGNDLSNFNKFMHPLTMAHQAKLLLEGFVDAFITFKKPLVVAVNGPAIGIAVTTLGLCDKVFASDTAYFKTPFAELGQAPEGCSSFMFPRIMGEHMSNEVLWHGKVLDANEAMACGLVHQVSAKESLEADAVAYCRELAALPAGSPQLVREIIRDDLVAKLRVVNCAECEVLERKWVSKECFQALAKFLESRNMKMAAMFLRSVHHQTFCSMVSTRFCRGVNATGFLWGQPE